MRIIALQGKRNTGKTTTLKKLIEIIWHETGFEHERIIGNFGSNGEMRCWVTRNGIKIGITTRGDGVVGLRGDFCEKKYNFHDRDIVVCAIRSKGDTYQFIKAHAKDGLLSHGRWFVEADAATPERMAEANEMQARAILEDILRFVKDMEVNT